MNPETLNMISTLRTAMQILNLRQAQVERTLGWSVSYLSKILSGKAELRFEHILDICRALGLKPQEAFRFAYPDWGEPPSEAGRRVREITGNLAGPGSPAPQPEARLTEKDLERMIQRTMRRMIREKLEE